MAGQGGLDADAMWAELKKADSSKIIDASHIPTSVLDGRWVKKTGDTMTGTLTSASTSGAIVFKGVENCDITNIYKDNGVIKNDNGGLTSIRNGLRFNWYDTYWYIGNIRGSSTESAGFGVVDHNNKLVLRVTPNDVRAPRFMSTVATGTAPFMVSSTTQVSNLNADLLDDRHGAYYQNRVCDTFVSQYNKYDYIEFLRFVIPSGQRQLRAYVVFDLCRTETGYESSGRAVLRLRRNTDNTASTLFYVTNFGRSTLPELRCTSDDGITWRIWMKCNKSDYDPYIAVKIVEQYPYGYVTTQNNGTTGTPKGTRHVFTALSAGISNAANFLVNSRTLWGQPFNGTANVSGDMTGVGSITMSGDLKIGNATSPNTIYFYGTTGDGPGGYNHTFIAERIWGGTGSGELVLFKGNDIGNGTDAITASNSGPDRIRHIAAAHLFQTYTTVLSGSVESVCTSSALKNLFSIASNRVISYVPFMSTVASGVAPFIVVSNTVVGNLNADLLDGFHENSFLRSHGVASGDGASTLWSQIGILNFHGAYPDGVTLKKYDYGAVVSMSSGYSRFDLYSNHKSSSSDDPSNGIQYRSGWGTDKRPWRMLLDNVNYASYSDGRYVKKAGDTMTGDLNISGGHILCSDWFRSTGNSGWYHQDYGGGWYMQDSTYIRNFGSKRLRIQTDTYDTLQLVRSSGSGGSSIAFYNGGGTFRGQFGMNATSWFTFDTGTATANQNVVEISPAGGIHSKAEITAKASGSDIRLKKDIQNYNAMDIINKFRSVKYHWNDVAKANSEVYNNDYDQFGLIAQDLIAGGFKQWVRDVFHDYYTVTYERLIPVVWKGLQEVDDEVTRLKKRVRELENRLGIYNQ